jgi:hypothetical protein
MAESPHTPMITRRSAFSLFVGIGSALIFVLIVLSPFALRLLAHGRRDDWALLSDIGQTYGAISALLSAGALTGVAVSVFIQIKELRHNREQAARAIQFDLLKMALEDPVYLQCVGPAAGAPEGGEDWSRQSIYINLLLNFWQMRWEFGDMTEEEIRGAGRDELFASEVGRRYWHHYGPRRALHATNRRSRRFNEIFSEEHVAAVLLTAST